MYKNFIFLLITIFFVFQIISCSQKTIDLTNNTVVYQSFETPFAAPGDKWSWGTGSNVDFSKNGEPVYEGKHSLKLTSDLKDTTGDFTKWLGAGFKAENGTWDTDFNPSDTNNYLTFWIFAIPNAGGDNTLSIEFVDNNKHKSTSTNTWTCIKYWTKQKTIYGQWTKIIIPFSEVYNWQGTNESGVLITGADFDFHNIDHLNINFYWGGTYYIDDIKATNILEIDTNSADNH